MTKHLCASEQKCTYLRSRRILTGNEEYLKFIGENIKINCSHFYKLVSYDNTSS